MTQAIDRTGTAPPVRPISLDSNGPADGAASQHVVQHGDTLAGVAARYFVDQHDLIAANPQLHNPDRIYVGDVVHLPASPSNHTIRHGETLNGIAARYGTTADALAHANGIANPNTIMPGDRLRVPGHTDQASAVPAPTTDAPHAPAAPATSPHAGHAAGTNHPTASAQQHAGHPSAPPVSTTDAQHAPAAPAASARAGHATRASHSAAPAGARAQFLAEASKAATESEKATGVPAAITIAQAMVESGWGKHHIGSANNYFGVKAQSHHGKTTFGDIATGYVMANTREHIKGRDVMVMQPFRAYKSMADSFTDHGRFLVDNPRYKAAMENYARTGDAREFARGLQKAGYATDQNYAAKLISNINKYKLDQYDVKKPETAPDHGVKRGGL